MLYHISIIACRGKMLGRYYSHSIPSGVLLTARVDVGIITAEDGGEHIGLVSAGHDGGVALSMHHFC